jgi:hypothetical protein
MAKKKTATKARTSTKRAKKAASKTAGGRRARTRTRARARVSTRRQAPSATFESAVLESIDSAAPAAQPRTRAARAPETVQVIFDLLDVFGRPIHDPETFFTFRRVSDNRQLGDQLVMALAGASPAFDLPVAASETMVCDIDPRRYRFVHSPPFFRTPGEPVRRHAVLMREPKEWAPAFTRWRELPASFADLKRALEASENVTLFRGDKAIARRLTDVDYDGMSGTDVDLAKTALLNIYFRLNRGREPASTRSWFSFVTRIVAIGRERLLAFVEPELEARVREISDHIDQFRAEFERTPAENHRGNVPPEMRDRIGSMVSIKSTHAKGNFQLTLTRLTGPDEVLLDADLDESGDLLGHTLDLLRHRFSGGTHPNDIHELLAVQEGKSPAFDLGYRLV